MLTTRTKWLAQLFGLYHRDAVRFATRILGDRDNGEEVVQNAWLNLCASRSSSSISHPKTYLFTATRNAAVDFAVQQQKELNRRVEWDALTKADLADNSVAIYEQRRMLAVLSISLNELPTSCRQAFILNKFEGLSHPEIARRLGISVSMV
ncbi:RNA polymerase sigma factor [Agrobacterium sp. T29]|uniref:RNA polymerase sigma factor n=1 Tax=Agrobacterium sp. T29 TaxID=2580515 RepID=UPI00115DDFC6|nr:sigma-70 family RNA polymerase sigma factor [Agrobacterium sp. T29]